MEIVEASPSPPKSNSNIKTVNNLQSVDQEAEGKQSPKQVTEGNQSPKQQVTEGKPWNSADLYRAIVKGDWKVAKTIFDNHKEAMRSSITEDKDTPLLLAVKRGLKNPFLKNILPSMTSEALVDTDSKGSTALHIASALGNSVAAALLVKKHRALCNIRNSAGYLPVHLACKHGHRRTTEGLLRRTEIDDESGAELMRLAFKERFYNVAVKLIENNPKLAQWSSNKAQNPSASPGSYSLNAIAQDPAAFSSGARFNFNIWHRFIYFCLSNRCSQVQPRKFYRLLYSMGNCILSGCLLIVKCWDRCCGRWVNYLVLMALLVMGLMKMVNWVIYLVVMLLLVMEGMGVATEMLQYYVRKLLQFPEIEFQIWLHDQAVELVKLVCEKIVELDITESAALLGGPFLLAAKYGNVEVVQEILKVYPDAISNFKDNSQRNALHLAIMYRQEAIFNIINQRSGDYKVFLSESMDDQNNNILHLAGYLPCQDRLDLVSATVLQVQRELQWYKEVERFVLSEQREAKNNDDKTPLMVFVEEHSKMITQEEKWMKGMANSCTVVATLIASVAFAAAITVPGGSNQGGKSDDGLPVFMKETAFKVFTVSNALALFFSLSTVIIFLAILISRYSTIDFLFTLPNKLIMGLVTLFFSATSMIISFSATLYLVSDQIKIILAPVAIVACLPVLLFANLQFPLLLNMMKTTYSPSILRSVDSSTESEEGDHFERTAEEGDQQLKETEENDELLKKREEDEINENIV